MRKIHTYYDRLPWCDNETIEAQERLLEVWIANWSEQGWEPVVLSRADAKMNPRFKKYLRAFRKFPSKNLAEYELSCFLRWVAMESIGDGFMCDYDVMNYGFNGHAEGDFTIYTKYVVPCMVWATSKGWSYVLDRFMNYDAFGKTHVSDQNILVDLIDALKVNRVYLCTEYKEEGNWYEYPLVHYPYERTDRQGLFPRWRYVREFNDIIRNLKG